MPEKIPIAFTRPILPRPKIRHYSGNLDSYFIQALQGLVHRPLLSSLAGLFLLAAPAQAFTVLVIDISNPAAVTFTSTGSVSLVDSSLNMSLGGFSIQNFFATAVWADEIATGNLHPTGSPYVYSGLGTFDYEGGTGFFGSSNDLSIYSNGGASTTELSQVFSTDSSAFNGVMTVNFSEFASSLPAAGTAGNVRAGYLIGELGHTGIVGEYIVVPEPSAVLLGGLGALALLKRRRKA